MHRSQQCKLDTTVTTNMYLLFLRNTFVCMSGNLTGTVPDNVVGFFHVKILIYFQKPKNNNITIN